MRLLRLIILGALALLTGLGTAVAAERVIIILDGSGSMWAPIEGETRISIARETLDEVLDSVPDDLELGFMSYGHRTEGDCDDIELMVEAAAGTAEAIRDAAEGITPLGKTPISAAVQLAAEDLSYLEEKATVILITDGIESCEEDPCELASDLEERGVNFTTHVVGFGLSDEEGAEVACLAENTGGTYFQASDGPALAEALTTTVTQVAEAEDETEEEELVAEPEEPEEPAAPEFNFDPELVMAEGGQQLRADEVSPAWVVTKAAADGSKGEYVTTEYGVDWKANLEPGDYIVTVTVDYATAEQPVTIVATETAKPLFNLNGGRVTIRPLAAEGAEADSSAAVYWVFPGSNSTTSYGETSYWVPAGESQIEVTIGRGKVSDTVAVAAGEQVTRDIVVGVGRAVLNAFYVEGMKVEDVGLAVNIRGAKTDIQGNAEDFGTSYGPDTVFDLPPGDYIASLTMGAAVVEQPFTVVGGERVNVGPVLSAGVLAIDAPGTDFVEVLGTTKDIQGNRKSFGYGYGGVLQTTLPAGDYVVTAEPAGGGDKKEATATVIAGERTELTIE
jgi:Ca-activated chloride channel family protein